MLHSFTYRMVSPWIEFSWHVSVAWAIRHSTPFNLSTRDQFRWDNISWKAVTVTDLWQAVHQSWYSGYVDFKCLAQHWGTKNSFLQWLIMHDRFNTLYELQHYGVVTDACCYFCINGIENVGRLFLECPYTQHVLNLTRARPSLFHGLRGCMIYLYSHPMSSCISLAFEVYPPQCVQKKGPSPTSLPPFHRVAKLKEWLTLANDF